MPLYPLSVIVFWWNLHYRKVFTYILLSFHAVVLETAILDFGGHLGFWRPSWFLVVILFTYSHYNPGPVIEPRVHYKVPDFSHLDYLTKALGFQNHRGVRVPDWSQLRNPRWRPAAILKMKFVISSHPIVIQSHVIYQNILFQTRRIHFCHHNWFSWSQN